MQDNACSTILLNRRLSALTGASQGRLFFEYSEESLIFGSTFLAKYSLLFWNMWIFFQTLNVGMVDSLQKTPDFGKTRL